ncbi:MAG: hypothetical protein M3O24_02985 [Thermoproteota archaeon]|nr:hypothetical protein [Thermoproteota archaeon]
MVLVAVSHSGQCRVLSSTFHRSLKVSLAHEAVGKAQDKLNALTNIGIKSGKAYEQATLDVKQALSQEDIQTQLLGEAQERMFDSQTQFTVSVIPTTLGAIGTLGSAYKDLGLKGDSLKKAITGIGAGASGAVGGVTALKGALSPGYSNEYNCRYSAGRCIRSRTNTTTC